MAGRDEASILLIEGLVPQHSSKPTSACEALAALKDTMTHHPMTKEQREILDQDLATIVKSLGDISTLLNACYGEKDPRAARAEESQAALQRLLWALERQDQSSTIGKAIGSARVREIVEINEGSAVRLNRRSGFSEHARRPAKDFGSASNLKRTYTKVDLFSP